MHERNGLSLDDIMLVPQFSPVKSRLDTDTTSYLTSKTKIKAPIMATNMATITEYPMMEAMNKVGGVGALHRFMDVKTQGEIVKKAKENGLSPVVASIGVGPEEFSRAYRLIKDGVDIILIDVAHGHSKNVLSQLKELKTTFPGVEYIVGNIATDKAASILMEYGADAVRVGIGGGANCTTRQVTGHGVPNLTALEMVVDARNAYEKNTGKYVPIILDGGIKNSGHIVKALALGADVACIGNLFAGTDETPGDVVDGYKKQYGMSSKDAQEIHKGGMKKGIAAEGITTLVPYKGSVVPIAEQLIGGVRSGLTYSGAYNVFDLRAKAEAMYISDASRGESKL